jgi:hypothetical protein
VLAGACCAWRGEGGGRNLLVEIVEDVVDL